MCSLSNNGEKMNRKSFLKKLAAILSTVAVSLGGLSILRQWVPVSFVRGKKIKIGKPYQYPMDSYTFIDKSGIYIYRDHEGASAVSAVCTHLGCIVHREDDKFICPCHGSVFNNNGEVLSGPAPTDLKWFPVEKGIDGSLIVNTG